MENETSLAMKLVTGTPSTMPADTPIKTLETALGACSLLTDAAATVKAIDTYTGCRKAGSIRAISNMVKLEVSMDMILLSVNNPSASSITFFRLIPENNKGVTGAEAATTNAKTLTVQPACGTETLKASAIKGRIPTTPISVFIMPNTPTVRIKTSKPPELSFNLFFCSMVTICNL